MFKKPVIILLVLLSGSQLKSQDNFLKDEKDLKALGDSILKGSTDSIRTLSSVQFNAKFEKVLNDSSSFFHSFDSLKNVSVLTSKDKKVRIYTWILPSTTKDKYSYFGFVQLYEKKLKKINLFKVEEGNFITEEAEKKSLNQKDWFGSLYYKMIENKTKGKTIYTLLGWRGNNRLTTMKVIDVLIIDKNIPKFGAPVFNSDRGTKHRIIFEYNAQAVMSLRFNEKKKVIVFDHLSPTQPELKGKFESYGPDLSYDGYKFKNGKWNYLKKIEVGNPKEFDVKTKETKIKGKEFYNHNQ